MFDDDSLYRALLAVFGLFAVGAVIMGTVGLYTVLIGGTTDGDTESDLLGEFVCEEFEADPEIVYASDYDVERTELSGVEVESFEPDRTDGRYRFELAVAGRVLDASAARADGTPLPVDMRDSDRVVVEVDGTAPFRLWIDSVAEDSTVTRTRLDICPPR
jgi:hypothetical protein